MNRVLPLRPLSALPDDRLIELTRAGSERAFETLATRHRRQLLIYAERMLGAENRAEDAVQQALLHAWLALRGGAEVMEARPWLYRIVHNCAVSMIRRPRHDTIELSEQLDATVAEPGHESRLELGEIFARLALMPEPQREAIVMTAIAGRSHEEAAAALGLTDGAVRGLVYRARSALRRAAAAVFPAGLWNWMGRSQSLGGDAVDAASVAGAAGSAGLAAAVVKGGAIVATAGVIAGAGHGLLHTSGPPPHASRAAAHSLAARPLTPSAVARAVNGRLQATSGGGLGLSMVTHRGDGNHDRHSRGSGEGRGGSASGSSRGHDGEHHGGGSGDGGGGSGGPGPSSNGGSGDSGTSGGSGPSGSSGSDGGDGAGQGLSGSGSSGGLDGSGKSGSDGGDGGSSGGPSVATVSSSTPTSSASATSDGSATSGGSVDTSGSSTTSGGGGSSPGQDGAIDPGTNVTSGPGSDGGGGS